MTKGERKEYNRKYRLANKDKIKENKKEYYNKNKERKKAYYEDNKEQINDNSETNKERKKENNKKYYNKNKEKINKRNKEWKEENKEKIKENGKKYYEENKEKIKRKNKKWSLDNKEKRKIISNNWNLNNKEKRKEIFNNWNFNNKEKRIKWVEENKDKINENHQRRYQTDYLYKLTTNIRNNIRLSFKKNNHKKTSKTQDILGISFKDFKLYIETMFEDWMTWDNHGSVDGKPPTDLNQCWDLDHIIPISTATTEEEIVKLNHYSNFQPLCSYYNRWIKRDNIIE